eukprot:NODE_460_length_8176_cov_0.585737.p3 type:complete len:283 gc:universal NODE_460_length_8176_cov_0.585737:539-1387(+)
MTFSTIAVLGATGTLGKPVTTALINKGFKVKIFTRDAEKSKKEFSVKAEYVTVDYKSKDGLIRELKGIDVVVSTLGGPAFNDQFLVLEAAKEAGVKRFYPSEFGAEINDSVKSVLFEPKLKLREALKASGIEWTIIENGLFLEYLYSPFIGFDHAKHTATLVGTKDTTISFTDLRSIGEFVAESINNPKSKNAKVQVAGDTKTFSDMVHIIEKATKATWTVTYIPVSEIQKKVDGNSNPWETIPEQLKILFAKSLGVIKHPQNKDYPAVIPTKLADYVKAQK